MDKCNVLKTEIKNAILNSETYEEFNSKLNMKDFRFNSYDPNKSAQLTTFLKSGEDKNSFLIKFLSQKDCGLDFFNDDDCVCKRWTYNICFDQNDFFNIFKINSNYHTLV